MKGNLEDHRSRPIPLRVPLQMIGQSSLSSYFPFETLHREGIPSHSLMTRKGMSVVGFLKILSESNSNHTFPPNSYRSKSLSFMLPDMNRKNCRHWNRIFQLYIATV